jgi:hypothetical protein
MALVYAESFDWQPSMVLNRPGTSWAVNSWGWSAGRINGRAFYCSVGSNRQYFWRHPLGAAYSQGVMAGSFKFPNAQPSNRILIQVQNLATGAYMVGVQANSDGSLSMVRDTTVLATSVAGIVAVTAWHRIEVGFTIHDTTGSYELRLDGVTRLTATNVDTKPGADTTIDTLYTFHPHDTYWDDVVFCSSSTEFLGDLHIESLPPNADTSLSGWTRSTGSTNYGVVDEIQVNTADYVTAATAPATDRYALPATVDAPAVVHGVQVVHQVLKDNTGPCTVRTNLVQSGTVANGTTNACNVSPLLMVDLHITKPGGGSWGTSLPSHIEIERVT